MKKGVNVYSEIGKLNKVFLHRLGPEIEGLVPDNLERLLFDDIPYLKQAQEEHDYFAKILRDNGVEVLYFAQELEKALADKQIRKQFIEDYLKLAEMRYSQAQNESITEFLMNLELHQMVEKTLSGIKKCEVEVTKKIGSLADIMGDPYPYYTDPLPNLYFTRDPGACVGNGLNINSMFKPARKREALCIHYMHKYNNDFMPEGTPKWYDYTDIPSIEGGDTLVLSKEIVAIGCSERTNAHAITLLAGRLLKGHSGFKKILVLDIPKRRAFMHLDTVFTMVDYDKFTIHPEIEGPLGVYEITMGANEELHFTSKEAELKSILSEEFKRPVDLIRCGGGDVMAAQREQWNDGSNTLAIAPGVVVTYSRNYVTNEILEKHGLKVLSIPSSEISRGRGGPRCMSMPIHRDDI